MLLLIALPLNEQSVALMDRWLGGGARQRSKQSGSRHLNGDRMDVDSGNQPQCHQGALGGRNVKIARDCFDDSASCVEEEGAGAAGWIEHPDALGRSAFLVGRMDCAVEPSVVEHLLHNHAGQPIGCVVFPVQLPIGLGNDALVEGAQHVGGTHPPIVGIDLP